MALGTVGIITNPTKILKVGPMINEIDYSLPADPIAAQSPDHTIMGNELTLDVATYNSFASDTHLTEGATPGYSNVGLQFNMLRAVVNNTHFRRAVLYLQDYTHYQSVMLSGVEGTASPSVLPCNLYSSACHNYHGGKAENLYGGVNLMKAISELIATEGDPNPNSRLYETNLTDISCNTSGGAVCSNLQWATGSPAGPLFALNWVGRSAHLHRPDIAVYVQGQAAKIGLDFTSHYVAFAGFSTASHYTYQQSVANVIADGVRIAAGPQKNYNTAPSFDWSHSTPAACPSGPSLTADCWDMYTFGYGFTGPALFNDAQFFNSAFGSSETDVSLYYNRTMDFATNNVLYATSVSQALTYAGKVSLYQMQNLPWINVFFENTLWAVLSDVWTGYAVVPTQGPDTLSGLFYTLLNVHQTCFPTLCKSGGTLDYGLYSTVDNPGGLTPLAQFNSVYDADITNQIYEGPTIIGPTQFTSPGKYTDWMLSYNGKEATRQSAALTIRASAFNGFTSSGPGVWTDFQVSGGPGVLSSAAQHIVHGQKFTLTFAPNIYFSDHVQMTAADYNFSLYVSDLALSPTLPDVVTPVAGLMAGSSGLIASNINPLTPFTITLYVNSTSVLNPLNIIVPVLPLHILKYFNIDASWSLTNTIDTSFNWANAIMASNGCSGCVATNEGPAPLWLTSLANLEVGTGPFTLRSWDGVAQAGTLLANPTYARANWQDNLTNNQVKKGNTFNFTRIISEWTYDPVACASSPDKVCQVPITAGDGLTTGTLEILNSAGHAVATYTLSCNGPNQALGACSGLIPTTTGVHIGANELQFTASYTYLGLARTWYQITGEQVTLH